MSQDLLKPVTLPPELAKLMGLGAKPLDRATEKPSEDFLAVLDRALAEKPLEKTAEPLPAAAEIRPADRPESYLVNDTAAAKTPVDSGINVQPLAASPKTPIDPAIDTANLNSHRLEKYHGRKEVSAEVRTVPKTSERSRTESTVQTESRTAAARAASATRASPETTGTMVQKATSPISQGLEGLGADLSAASSKKVNRKTGESTIEETVEIGRKKLASARTAPAAPNLAEAALSAKPAVAGKGELAAEKMQLHADTGGTKGLQDALSVVKNLADRLGLGNQANADSVQNANRIVDLSRNPGNLTLLRPQNGHGQAKVSEADDKSEKVAQLRNSRIDVLRSERLNRSEGGNLLQKAADAGRVQVVDQRGQAPRSSLVLESMLSDKSKTGQAGRGDETRKDSLQLLNTAYLTPVNERNTVSIPVHLTGTQQGNLQQALKSHMQNGGNSEIVQQARIIMKGQESGEIKLILKPENLGEVRIHLQMQDGHIAGQIFVENKEVQAAFQDNLNSLMQAFQDGGLSTGEMQVTVDPRGTGQGGQGSQPEQQFAEDRSEERRKIHAVRSLENSVATVASGDEAYSQINLVV